MEALEIMLCNFLALDVNKIMFKTMSDNPILEKLAIQLNQEKQLKFGLTANDGFLGEYSDVSIEIFGKDPGPIQLKESGIWYDSFEVILQEDGFFIDALEERGDTNLFVEFGEDITGLNDDSLDFFIGRLIPLIEQTILKMIFRNVF